MSTKLDPKFIELLKSYCWNELYNLVKDTEYDPQIPIVKQYKLAIKIMLLSTWWGDNENIFEILKKYPIIINDPMIHFCVTNAYMYSGDIKKGLYYKSKSPKNQSNWMKIFIELELLGRSLKDEQQIKLLISSSSSRIDNAYITAILHSLEHNKCNLIYLKEYLKKVDFSNNSSSLFKAILIKTDFLDYKKYLQSNDSIVLSICVEKLLKDCLLRDALIILDKLVQLGFVNMTILDIWLKLSMTLKEGKEYFFNRYEFAMSIVPNTLFAQGTISCYAMIESWIRKDYEKAYYIASKFHEYKDRPNKKIRNYQIFYIYTINLCIQWQDNKEYYEYHNKKNLSDLLVFGESHSMSSANICFNLNDKYKIAITKFIMGIKMYHLAKPDTNDQVKLLLERFKEILPNTDIMFTIGEIDTRPDEGIWQVHLKKQKDLDEIILDTVGGYLNFLYENLKDINLSSVTIQGIPAPNYELKDDKDPKDEIGFLNMIKKVNEKLKELTLQKGWNFLDVYGATVGEDLKSNKKWHIDGYHLSPVFYPIEADKWLIKPEPKEQPKSTAIDFSKYQTISLSKPS